MNRLAAAALGSLLIVGCNGSVASPTTEAGTDVPDPIDVLLPAIDVLPPAIDVVDATDTLVDAPATDLPFDAKADPTPQLPRDVHELWTNGISCTVAADCQSGHCEGLVCCDTACAGPCKTCGLTGAVGTCTLVPEGTDPYDQCDQSPASSCQRDGVCDGRGACRLWAAGTECAPPICTGTTERSNLTCDGHGGCGFGTLRSCPGGCMNGSCPAPCGSDHDCLSGTRCGPGGTCVRRQGKGQACAKDGECTTGHCVDSVCCDTACTGGCEACSLPELLGTCSPVPLHQDPRSQCVAIDFNPCGPQGCDGAGRCWLPGNGAPCGPDQYCDGQTCLHI
jgi:hypothetical protein